MTKIQNFLKYIMQKAAPLIFSSESNLANCSSRHHEAFLAKQTDEVMANESA